MRTSKRAKGVLALVATGALVAGAAVAQAATPPRWFINGVKATTKHEPVVSLGKLTYNNVTLKELTCENFFTGTVWNEVVAATERGFGENTGYVTWECKAAQPCEVTNEHGVKKEGTFVTAEGPPSYTEKGTEKRLPHHTGNTSLPWSEELTEKAGNEKELFVHTKHIKLWIDTPVAKSEGGPGEGLGCSLLGGKELPFEGDELAPVTVNGIGNGLTPSSTEVRGTKGCLHGCTEKGEVPETGNLSSLGGFGDLFITGKLITAGSVDFELVTAQER